MSHLAPALEERALPRVKDANELDSPRAYRLHQVEQERARTAAKRAYREAQHEAELAIRRSAVKAAKREAQERARSAALRRKMKTDFFAARAERQRKEDQERLLLAEKRRRVELGENDMGSDTSISDDDDIPDIDAMKASGLAPSLPSMLDAALPSGDGQAGPGCLSPTPAAGGAGGLFAKKEHGIQEDAGRGKYPGGRSARKPCRQRPGHAVAAHRFAQHVGGGVTVGGAGTHVPVPSVTTGSRAYSGVEGNLDVVVGGLVYQQQRSPVVQTSQHSSAICSAETEAWHRREAKCMRQARAERRKAEKELQGMLARENAVAAAAAKADRVASQRDREQAAELRRQRGASGGVVPASAILQQRGAEQALEREAAASRVAACRSRTRERLQSRGLQAAGRVGPAVARLEREANELRTKRQLAEEKDLADRRANAASQRRARSGAIDARRATDVRRKKLAQQVKRASERYQAVGGIVGQEQARAVTAHSSVLEHATKQAQQGEAPWWTSFGVSLEGDCTGAARVSQPESREESTWNEVSSGDGPQQEGGRVSTAALFAKRSLELDAQVILGDSLTHKARMPLMSKKQPTSLRPCARPAIYATTNAYRIPAPRCIAPPPFHDTHRPPPLRWCTNQGEQVTNATRNEDAGAASCANPRVDTETHGSLRTNSNEAKVVPGSGGAQSSRTLSKTPSLARKSFVIPADLARGAVGESPDDVLLTTLALTSTDSKQSSPVAPRERATRIAIETEGSARAAARAATSTSTKRSQRTMMPSVEQIHARRASPVVEECAHTRERLQSRSPSERFGFGTLRAETDASNPKQSLWTASLQRQQIELERRRAKFPFDEASYRELSLVHPQLQRLNAPGKSKAIDHSLVTLNSLDVQVATAADGRAPPTASPCVRAELSTPRQSLLLAQPMAIEAAPKRQQYFDALRPWTGHI